MPSSASPAATALGVVGARRRRRRLAARDDALLVEDAADLRLDRRSSARRSGTRRRPGCGRRAPRHRGASRCSRSADGRRRSVRSGSPRRSRSSAVEIVGLEGGATSWRSVMSVCPSCVVVLVLDKTKTPAMAGVRGERRAGYAGRTPRYTTCPARRGWDTDSGAWRRVTVHRRRSVPSEARSDNPRSRRRMRSLRVTGRQIAPAPPPSHRRRGPSGCSAAAGPRTRRSPRRRSRSRPSGRPRWKGRWRPPGRRGCRPSGRPRALVRRAAAGPRVARPRPWYWWRIAQPASLRRSPSTASDQRQIVPTARALGLATRR